MSIVIESATAASAASLARLIKEWSNLREAKKEEELKTPEWKQLEKSYIEHLKWRFDYPKKVFGQQILANWIITFVVLALVVSGLVFSFLQLQYPRGRPTYIHDDPHARPRGRGLRPPPL